MHGEEADEAEEGPVVRSFHRPGGVPVVPPPFKESRHEGVALRPRHRRAGKVLPHFRIGVHGRERRAVLLAPPAEQEARRPDLWRRRHRTIIAETVGILGA